jgi:hypothetical protein
MTDITHNNKYVRNVHLNVKLVQNHHQIAAVVSKLDFSRNCKKKKIINHILVKMHVQINFMMILKIFVNHVKNDILYSFNIKNFKLKLLLLLLLLLLGSTDCENCYLLETNCTSCPKNLLL